MTPHDPIRAIDRAARARANTALAGALGLAAVAAAGDWATGPELSFSAFYLPAVALAGWRGGRARAVVAALACAGMWLAMDRLAGPTYSHAYVPYWNATVRLVIFAVVALLSAEVGHLAEALRAGGQVSVDLGGSFYVVVEREFARLVAEGHPLTLAYVDAGPPSPDDGVRDAPADDWPTRVAETARATLRASDVVARPRGRELALLLPGTGPDAAGRALERLRAALEALPRHEGPLPPLMIGAITCVAPPDDLNHVLQRAYQLMYTAPRAGRVTLQAETFAGEGAEASAVA